jgi:hypothetical protein
MSGVRGRTGQSRLSIRYLDDNFLLSKTHAWTYVRIPGARYEFMSSVERESAADRITLALNGLLTSGTATIDCHVIVTSRPFEVTDWMGALNQKVGRWGPKPSWNGYSYAMAEHLYSSDFAQKETYLGICLGPRPQFDFKTEGFLGPLKRLVKSSEKVFLLEDFEVAESEIEEWSTKAQAIRRSLGSSHVRAVGATSDEVAWLVTKPLWPGMVTPPPTSGDKRQWGRGELESLGQGVIQNGYRSLNIEQFDSFTGDNENGFTATLAVSRFPATMYFPEAEPWIHYSQSLPFSVDHTMRFKLVPPQQARKDVSKRLIAAQDQAAHIAEGGLNVPMEIREHLVTAEVLQHEITKNQTPWLYGRYRMRVTAPDEKELKGRVKQVIDHYRDLGIDVVWPSGDQLELLLESMPGDKVRINAYQQRQEVPVLSGGMPTATSDIGDVVIGKSGWLGPYIGECTSRMRLPVFFSPHVAMAQNASPGVAILGQPGSGKSFLAFTLAYQSAVQGIWTIYIDPKADAKPMGLLPGMGASKVFDLRDGHDGMLDPFSMGDDINQSKLLALETLRLLLGGTHLSEEREAALIASVEAVSGSARPSLWAVVEHLLVQPNTASQNVGAILRTLRDMPFARLAFAPTGGDRLRPEDGLTIVTLLGLDLPSASLAPENYSYENRLGVSVMYLLTRYARQLMLNLDKSHPKAIFIDEAWAITGTPQGAKLIPETARMGRSHNTALILVSQNAMDLMDEQITNSISTVFAFRSRDETEVNAVLSLLGTEKNDGNRAAVRELFNGECLMRDVSGRVSRVQVDAWEPALWETFNTNPETRGKVTQSEGG